MARKRHGTEIAPLANGPRPRDLADRVDRYLARKRRKAADVIGQDPRQR